jgi:hypothetical protein
MSSINENEIINRMALGIELGAKGRTQRSAPTGDSLSKAFKNTPKSFCNNRIFRGLTIGMDGFM